MKNIQNYLDYKVDEYFKAPIYSQKEITTDSTLKSEDIFQIFSIAFTKSLSTCNNV